MVKRFLVVCVFFLLIVSSIGSLSLSQDSNLTEKNKFLEDLKFYCTIPDSFNEVKFEDYKKQVLKQYTDEGINQIKTSDSEELIISQNQPITEFLFNVGIGSSLYTLVVSSTVENTELL